MYTVHMTKCVFYRPHPKLNPSKCTRISHSVKMMLREVKWFAQDPTIWASGYLRAMQPSPPVSL